MLAKLRNFLETAIFISFFFFAYCFCCFFITLLQANGRIQQIKQEDWHSDIIIPQINIPEFKNIKSLKFKYVR